MTTFAPQNATDHRIDEMTTNTPLQTSDSTGLGCDQTELFIPWKNPHNIISIETYLTFAKAISCGVNLIIFCIGVPTNLLNCLVFYRQGLRDRMNLCLFSLAWVDMLYVASLYLVGSHCHLRLFRPELGGWWKVVARKYFTGLFVGFLSSSGLLTMVIAVERCVCVTLPLKAATLVKTRTIAVIIVGVVVSLQGVCLLYPLEISIRTREDPNTGGIIYFLATSEFYFRQKILFDVLENTFLMIVIPFTTFTSVMIATAITVVQLKRAIAWRHGSSSSSSSDVREVALVKMLVVVSLIYITSSAPNIALGLTKLMVPDFLPSRKYANIFLASHLMYLVLAEVNSSVNFFVYLARSSRFRQELRGLLRLRPTQSAKAEAEGKHAQQTVATTTLACAGSEPPSGGVHLTLGAWLYPLPSHSPPPSPPPHTPTHTHTHIHGPHQPTEIIYEQVGVVGGGVENLL